MLAKPRQRRLRVFAFRHDRGIPPELSSQEIGRGLRPRLHPQRPEQRAFHQRWRSARYRSTADRPTSYALTPSDRLVAGRRVIRLGDLSRPTITLYRPRKEIDPASLQGVPGAAVLIAAGRGYQILTWDLEGPEIAE